MRKLISETAFPVLFNNGLLSLYHSDMFKADKNIGETSFRQVFLVNSASEGFNLPAADDRPERAAKAVFGAIGSFLSKRKVTKENEATALVLQDLCGNFIFMALVEYHPNVENPDEPGNWSLTMSFYEKDLDEVKAIKNVKEYYFSDSMFKQVFDATSRDLAGVQVENEMAIYDINSITIRTLLQLADYEAIEGEVVDVEYPDLFTLHISVENGSKIVAITPSPYLKSLIKEDVKLDND